MNTLDDIDAALKALAKEREQTPDPDEFSAEQYAEHVGGSVSHCNKALLDGYKAGRLTRRKIGVRYYYRLAK